MSASNFIGRAFQAVLVALACAGGAHAATHERFQDLSVDIVGSGRPVLMIPGLNSAASTWADTCAALQPVQCHMVQLPGFAGLPAVPTAHFMEDMRDRLLAYIAARHLGPMPVVGHSLGGELALMMAAKSPDSVSRLVIVDSLPFLGAVRDPSATPATTRPMAEQMRSRMAGATPEQTEAAVRPMARGMAHAPADVERLVAWGLASDRATTAQAWYELWTTDLRADIGAIRCPTLVLGSWAAYATVGATEDSTRAIFEAQYAALRGVRIHMSKEGYHFLMWDDPAWFIGELREALRSGA